MKIGITAGLSSADFRWGSQQYKKLKELGYDSVDFQMSDTNNELYSLNSIELEKLLKHEKQLAQEAGVQIYQSHGPWRFPPRDYTAEDRAERMEKMKKSVYMASLLECPNWIVHPIMPFGLEEASTTDASATWDMNVEFMSDLVHFARDYGVTVCIENMPFLKFSLSKPADILRLVEAVNSDNFRICLDTGHVAVFNELSAGEEVRRLGDMIRAFHVHDNKLNEDLHLWPFFGVTDWKNFGKAVRDIGFRYPVSIEATIPNSVSDDVYEHMCKTLNMLAREIFE